MLERELARQLGTLDTLRTNFERKPVDAALALSEPRPAAQLISACEDGQLDQMLAPHVLNVLHTFVCADDDVTSSALCGFASQCAENNALNYARHLLQNGTWQGQQIAAMDAGS